MIGPLSTCTKLISLILYSLTLNFVVVSTTLNLFGNSMHSKTVDINVNNDAVLYDTGTAFVLFIVLIYILLTYLNCYLFNLVMPADFYFRMNKENPIVFNLKLIKSALQASVKGKGKFHNEIRTYNVMRLLYLFTYISVFHIYPIIYIYITIKDSYAPTVFLSRYLSRYLSIYGYASLDVNSNTNNYVFFNAKPMIKEGSYNVVITKNNLQSNQITLLVTSVVSICLPLVMHYILLNYC